MNWKNIWAEIRSNLSSIVHGEFLLKIGCDKYFMHILYTFFLIWMMIWTSIKIENTLAKVEKNNEILNDMKIYHAQKTVQMISLNRITVVDKLLKENGSEVTLPIKPADRIEK